MRIQGGDGSWGRTVHTTDATRDALFLRVVVVGLSCACRGRGVFGGDGFEEGIHGGFLFLLALAF